MNTTSKALSLQAKKKTVALENINKAQEAFLTIYDGKLGEKKFLQEKQFAILAIQKNPEILNCTPASIFTAVASVAMTNLTLNPVLGLCHLVPRGQAATLVVDYKGLLELLLRTGKIESISAGVVYEGDEFDYMEGSEGYVKHKRSLKRQPKAVFLAAYCAATFANGKTHVHILDAEQIDKRRKVASTDKVWEKWFDEMAIKTTIRSHYKYLPKTQEITTAMELVDREVGAKFNGSIVANSAPEGIFDEEEVTEAYNVESQDENQ
jgi:recombination protein RecT